MRVQLSNEVADLINDFGPTLYEDFNEVCVLEINRLLFTQLDDSGASWFPLQACHLRVGHLVCGVERAVLVLLMPKV